MSEFRASNTQSSESSKQHPKLEDRLIKLEKDKDGFEKPITKLSLVVAAIGSFGLTFTAAYIIAGLFMVLAQPNGDEPTSVFVEFLIVVLIIASLTAAPIAKYLIKSSKQTNLTNLERTNYEIELLKSEIQSMK